MPRPPMGRPRENIPGERFPESRQFGRDPGEWRDHHSSEATLTVSEAIIARGKKPIARLTSIEPPARVARLKVGEMLDAPLTEDELKEWGLMRVLLDACTFLWLALEPARLSQTAVATINDPANELFLSDASVWEITLKHTAGKLPLPALPRSWIPSRRGFFGLVPLPITVAHTFRAADLPCVHPDPFDRLLAAQALESGLTILSPDEALSTLGAARVW